MIDGLFDLEPVSAGARLPSDWDEEYHEASKIAAPVRAAPAPDDEPEPVAAESLVRLLAVLDTSLQAIVLARLVPGLARGAFDYDQDARLLRRRSAVDPARFHAAVQLEPTPVPAVSVALLATFAPFRDRHGLRGYRYALVSAGRAAQALVTAGPAHGLRVRTWGSWVDDAADRQLGLDGVDRSCVYLLGVDAAG